MSNIIIIGGGVGGLFTGAILAKEGLHVTLLEKNATIGGGFQTFHRFGEAFDTGMHVIGGMQPGDNVWRICKYLGILDRVQLRDVDDDCTDCIYFAEDQQRYRIAKGREGFIDSLAKYFPTERANLERYVEAVHTVVDEARLFNLLPSLDTMTIHSDDFLMASDAFIAKYVSDRRLRSVLAYMNPLYGGRAHETPSFIHCVITQLYIAGASRFVGGSARFADLLASVITDNGGEVVAGDGVTRIDVENRHVISVSTKSGKTYTADRYISAIHPCALLRLLPEKAFPKSYRTRLEEISNSYSAFSLYIKLRKESFPYINHSEYYMTRYDDIWNFGRTDRTWPMGFLVMTPPDDNQGPYASKLLVTAPMLFSEVSAWEDTKTGHRGEDYKAWKEEKTKLLLDRLEEMHPGITACIDRINSASPLTIRDFYGSKDGCLCGYSKDISNLALSQVPVVTKVDNLLLTGQNNNLHGFCGVALTAIQTSEAILGRNSVLNKMQP